MKMNNKGFTLVELLVVIAIIGLLSTLAVVALGTARLKSRDVKRLADLKQIQTALELYFTDHNAYPVAAAAVTLGTGNYACLDNNGFEAANCANGTVYMGIVPKDPSTNNYTYVAAAPGTTYTMTATLEGTSNGFSGNVRATPSGLSQG